MVIEIQSEKEFDTEIGEAAGYVLLDFYATWCRPCKMMAAVLEKADAALDGKVKCCRIDTDRFEEIAADFQLVGVPTFILFKDGEEKGRVIGYNDFHAFMEKLEKLME